MINNLKIGTRLLAGFLFLALMLLVMALLDHMNIKAVNDGMTTLFNDRTVPIQQLSSVNAQLLKSRGDLYKATLFSEELATIHQEVASQFQTADKEWAAYKATDLLPAEKEALSRFEPAWATVKQESSNILEAIKTRNMEAVTRTIGKGGQYAVSRATAQAALEQLIEINTKEADRTNTEGDKTYATANLISITVTVSALLLAVFMGILLTRNITRPLIYGVNFAKTIAVGNLTQRIDPQYLQRGDEIGDLAKSLDQMAVQLKDTVGQVTQATSQVSSAAAEIAQGSSDLSQRTEEQASALEQTASSMEELTSTVKQSADNAGQANQLASAARTQAEQGGHVVDQAITAMSAINQSSRKIADIIGVIDEIAFQTNLLALNAAVEAARAGEQGRGFAVVAGEVRKLAQRSADAAKEIKGLITDSVTKVEDGGKLVEQSGQTLREIVTSVKKVSDIVAEIAAAAREQASGIEQVNKAILQMDQVTQQNAALVEQTAAASHAMGDQAQELQNLMGFFKLDDTASTPTAHLRTVERNEFKREKIQPISRLSAGNTAGSAGDQAALITWSDALSVNDPDIDQQHQKLVRMINDLHNAMRKGQNKSAMGNLLNRLLEYTVEHFSYEEGRMEACHYPNIKGHKVKHVDLVQQVTALQDKFNSGSQHLNMKVMRFLKDWITNHIQKSDKDYMPYMQAQR
ncbi:MAG: bacteriohemerythrin [Candidatus Competibacteraceae bacterium]|nr:bacteriohemerythrin [Candidatus Competibacteraceae bacterium]